MFLDVPLDALLLLLRNTNNVRRRDGIFKRRVRINNETAAYSIKQCE